MRLVMNPTSGDLLLEKMDEFGMVRVKIQGTLRIRHPRTSVLKQFRTVKCVNTLSGPIASQTQSAETDKPSVERFAKVRVNPRKRAKSLHKFLLRDSLSKRAKFGK